MHDEILARLAEVEAREGVRIIFACESGSRAWGFASLDSDYDVRFLYVHPRDWYLSVYPGRDVIELPIVDDLDINGWDLRKTLRLLRKSNPTLLEWLDSPIIYRRNAALLAPLLALAPQSYNPLASCHHYLSMSSHNNTQIVSREGTVKRKKYLYVLRSLLAARWTLECEAAPPMEFEKLLAAFDLPAELRAEIDTLLALKRSGTELDSAQRIPLLDAFAEAERERILSSTPPPIHSPPAAAYDQAFREILQLAWHG